MPTPGLRSRQKAAIQVAESLVKKELVATAVRLPLTSERIAIKSTVCEVSGLLNEGLPIRESPVKQALRAGP